MGRKHLQLVKTISLVLVLLCLGFLIYWIALDKPEQEDSISDDSYMPMVTHNELVYLYDSEYEMVPKEATLVGEIDINLGSLSKRPDHKEPDKYVSNSYRVGTPVYEDGSFLYIELPNGIVAMRLDEEQ